MKFVVAFDGWILYHYIHLVNFPFSYRISFSLDFTPSVKLIFSKELSFLRNNNDVDSLTNLFTDQADLQFQSPNLESQSAFTWSKLTIETLEKGVKYVQS